MSESLRRFMGERRIGVFGDYTEEGNGWSKIIYIARKIANTNYSVLTGKSVFKNVKGTIIEFPFFLRHIANVMVETRTYCKWLVRHVPQAIILLGKYRSTSAYEEEETCDCRIETYGISIIDTPKKVDSCESLKTLSIKGSKFSLCDGKIGECLSNKGKYCPFIEKGTPLGTIDLYVRHRNMHLMATKKKENLIKILKHLSFLV